MLTQNQNFKKPPMRKIINWENYSKILKQHSPKQANRIKNIVVLLVLISFAELISSAILYWFIMPWWLAILIAYCTWIIFSQYNLNLLYILFITVFKNNELMISMIEEKERWSEWKRQAK